MKVLVIEPLRAPQLREIGGGLHDLQKQVGGDIQAIYPFDDDVALVCNEEGKLSGLPLNRALFDEDGELYDVIAGTFLIVGLGDDDFCDLPEELAKKYARYFQEPEFWF
jgi:hypothetical protein